MQSSLCALYRPCELRNLAASLYSFCSASWVAVLVKLACEELPAPSASSSTTANLRSGMDLLGHASCQIASTWQHPESANSLATSTAIQTKPNPATCGPKQNVIAGLKQACKAKGFGGAIAVSMCETGAQCSQHHELQPLVIWQHEAVRLNA